MKNFITILLVLSSPTLVAPTLYDQPKTIEISKNWPKAKPKLVVHLGGMSLNKIENNSNENIYLHIF